MNDKSEALPEVVAALIAEAFLRTEQYTERKVDLEAVHDVLLVRVRHEA